MSELVHELGLEPGMWVAVIGAGGTTRLLGRIAVDWAAHGGRPWLAGTTRMDDRELPESARVLRLPEEAAARAGAVRGHPARGRAGEAVAAGVSSRATGPLASLEEAEIAGLASLWGADLVLVKADGARGQPFKAHAEHEPAIPARADLVIAVAGLWVLGQPLGDESVHRAALAAERWGYALGEPVDERLVARALAEPDGYRRRVPARARYLAYLNHRGEPALAAAADRVAAALAQSGVRALSGDPGGGETRR